MRIKMSTAVVTGAPTLAVSVAPVGARNTTQSYDEASGEYIPDRLLAPTILDPTVMSGDKDVRDEVSAKGWYVLDSGKETQITSATSGFELYPSGYPLGIKVLRNVSPDKPLILLFKVTARGITTMSQVSFRTDVIQALTPDLELDFPASSAWNPFYTDRDTVVITPTVRDFGHTDLSIHWLKQAGTTWREIDTSDPEDCELDLDPVTMALSINRRWMGEELFLRCELRKDGEMIRCKNVSMRRRIPGINRLDARYSHYISDDDTDIYCEADIELESMGRVANPSKEFLINWLNGTSSFGTGNSATYKRKKGEKIPDLAMEVNDRGPLCLFTVNGQYLTVGGTLIGGR